MSRTIGRPRDRFQTRRVDRLAIDNATAVCSVLDSFESRSNLSDHFGISLREHQVFSAQLVNDRLIDRVRPIVVRLARQLNVATDLSYRLLLELHQPLSEPLDINSTLLCRVCHIAIKYQRRRNANANAVSFGGCRSAW
jgi:hypothetical protein